MANCFLYKRLLPILLSLYKYLKSGKHVCLVYAPLNPTLNLYSETGVYRAMQFFFLVQKLDYGYSLEPHINVLSEILKKNQNFYFFFFLKQIFCILHGQVFVMILAFHNEKMHMLYTEILFLGVRIKNLLEMFGIFHIFAKNIDCGYTLENPQYIFWNTEKKNSCSPFIPSFTI